MKAELIRIEPPQQKPMTRRDVKPGDLWTYLEGPDKGSVYKTCVTDTGRLMSVKIDGSGEVFTNADLSQKVRLLEPGEAIVIKA